MKDNNLIQIVDFYGQSRNVSAYYGRTAKMYLLNEEKEKAELSILKKKDFEDFLLQLNPEIPSNEIKSTINKVMGFGKNDFSEIISWLETNMKYFGSSDEVNQHSIFNLMLFLRIHDSEIFDAITELKSLLKL